MGQPIVTFADLYIEDRTALANALRRLSDRCREQAGSHEINSKERRLIQRRFRNLAHDAECIDEVLFKEVLLVAERWVETSVNLGGSYPYACDQASHLLAGLAVALERPR